MTRNNKQTLIKAAAYRSAPLPHPSEMERYEQILPGAAERIFKVFEDQSKHRQTLEKRVIDSECLNSRLGIICALCIALVTIIGAIICVMNGHELGGGILGTGGLTSLVTVFIYGSRQRRQERELKSKA
jgi:uncharacterized membrane protein